MATEEGHKLCYSGDASKHQHGVGFIVKKERANSVLSCTPVSSRIISICISARPKIITVIQVYAPTQDYADEVIEEFYDELDTTIRTTSKKDLLIVVGDWNAKVGPDAYNQWSGSVGRFGEGDTNDRGLRLLEFTSGHSLTLANILFPHKTQEEQPGILSMAKCTTKLISSLYPCASKVQVQHKHGSNKDFSWCRYWK